MTSTLRLKSAWCMRPAGLMKMKEARAEAIFILERDRRWRGRRCAGADRETHPGDGAVKRGWTAG